MAVYFDSDGKLRVTDDKVQFLPEGSDRLPPNPFRSPGTADDAFANLIGLPATQDMGYLLGVPETSNAGYLIGTSGTADDVFPFEPPGTADDRIANLISVPGTADDVFPFAPKNRLVGLDLNKFQGINSLGVANEADETDEVVETKTGIPKLFEFLQNLPTPLNLIRGGLESLSGFNQRLRNTDFGRSKNLMDFLDMKKYGGYQGREDARAATMAQARGIQKKIDAGDFGTASAQDKARGQMPSRTTSAPKRSSSFDSSARGRALHG